MSVQKIIVETESGSLYPVIIEKHMLGKTKMRILIKGKEEIIAGVGSDKVEGILAGRDKGLSEDDIVPGKMLVFSQGGHTSRIKKVYVEKN